MSKQFYTYLHCKPNGDPFYVGKGSGKRASNFYKRNAHHKAIVAKYGKSNIGVYVFCCDSEQEAFADEIHQIAQLRSEGLILANVTNGGDGVSGLSKPVSEPQKEKLRITSLGNKNALGWRHTPESLKKMKESKKRSLYFNEMMEKLRLSNQKPVVCIDTGEIFDSATIAAEFFKIKDKSSVTQCCRGKCKTAYGMIFKYV